MKHKHNSIFIILYNTSRTTTILKPVSGTSCRTIRGLTHKSTPDFSEGDLHIIKSGTWVGRLGSGSPGYGNLFNVVKYKRKY